LNDNNDPVARLIRREAGIDTLLVEREVLSGRIYFKVEAHRQAYQFYLAEQSENWQPFGSPVDGRILSTPVAGGFTGAYLGIYASSNGETSDNFADFDWFEYKGI
jgi:xylan 1,4-beta-xylosidase